MAIGIAIRIPSALYDFQPATVYVMGDLRPHGRCEARSDFGTFVAKHKRHLTMLAITPSALEATGQEPINPSSLIGGKVNTSQIRLGLGGQNTPLFLDALMASLERMETQEGITLPGNRNTPSMPKREEQGEMPGKTAMDEGVETNTPRPKPLMDERDLSETVYQYTCIQNPSLIGFTGKNVRLDLNKPQDNPEERNPSIPEGLKEQPILNHIKNPDNPTLNVPHIIDDNPGYVPEDSDGSIQGTKPNSPDRSGTNINKPEPRERFVSKEENIGDSAFSNKNPFEHTEAKVPQLKRPESKEPDSRPLKAVTHALAPSQLQEMVTAGHEVKREALPFLHSRPLNSGRVDNVPYVGRDGNGFIVTLEPDGLGKLNIHLNLDNGSINVEINVSNDSTKNLIESNIRHIVDSLLKEGLSVGGLSVQLDSGRWNWDGTHDSQSINPDNSKDIEEVHPTPGPYPSRYAMRGLINIFV